MTTFLESPPSSATTLSGRLVAVEDLKLEDRARMFRLLDRHFDGVSERRFSLDLENKHWALLLERLDADQSDATLAGFTTLRFDREVATPLGTVDVLSSGDTLVAPDAWSSSNLAPAWITAVRSLARDRRLLWLLIVSGWRTYRFLPIFWRRFAPRWDRRTPDDMLRTLRQLGRELYGGGFEPATGIVRLAEPQRLRGELAGIPEARRTNPHVEFFARANPGHGAGDELVCLTEICDDNLTPAGRRMVARGKVLVDEQRC
ncbi:MAG: hypothetical protein MPN21_04760 [Thermoanaerobaculia bacterium]|nr:hypothetical protein [Thermoanaerobaculia bacterium]